MNSKLKKTLTWTAALALAALMLVFAFKKVDWKDFGEILKGCNFWLILSTIAMQWLITYLRGNRWRLLMKPLSREIKRRETYDAYALCYLANLVFPRSGEVVRCGLVAETRKASFEGSLGTVVIERTWDILCVFLSCIPLLFFGNFRDFLVEKIFKPASGALDIGSLWIILICVAALAATAVSVKTFGAKIKGTKSGSAIFRFCAGLAEGVKAGFRMENKWAFFAYTIAIWTGYWLCSLWTLHAFPSAASMTGLDALFLMVVGSLGWMVPVQGGFGAYHLIVTMTLIPIYSLTYDTAMAFAVVSHESQVLQMLATGLVSIVGWSIYKRRRTTAAQP